MPASTDLSVLVMSCDPFDDVWKPFFTLFKRYWPNCSYPKFFCTDANPVQEAGFVPLTPGKGLAWSFRLKYAVEQIQTPYVLFLQDDFFLEKPVLEADIEEVLTIQRQEKAGLMRIFPTPGPDRPYKAYPQVGLVSQNADYRISCQAAIWERNTLLQLIDETENIWQFELEGTKRAQKLDKLFLSVYTHYHNGHYPVPYFCTAVLKGKWMRSVLPLLEKENLKVDFKRRGVQSRYEAWRDRVFANSPKPVQGYVWLMLYKWPKKVLGVG